MTSLSRRDVLKFGLFAGVAAIVHSVGGGVALAQGGFSIADFVTSKAKSLADAAFSDKPNALPSIFSNMSFDSYRDIRFRADKALLAEKGSPYRLQLFHRGFLYEKPVSVNIVREGNVQTVPYSKDLFDYGKMKVDEALSQEIGYAGLRIHYPLNDPRIQDELIVFLGASYFRLLSRGQRFGLSARGLAIDTALPSGEEFPHFKEFWIEPPKAGDTTIRMAALLDSPSVTGAYFFTIEPGSNSTVQVQATIFPRKPVKKLGLAPLTSMFLYGEQRPRPASEYRPEIHDSDGLLINTGSGEWIWRPLRNPKSLSVSAFVDKNMRGFGLMQRDRQFSHYQDLDLHYERRPSYFVQPIGDWGEGHVELVEIPTPDETNDNIVALWVPKDELKPQVPFSFGFQLTATDDGEDLHTGGKALNAFIKPLMQHEAAEYNDPMVRRVMVDFAGGDLDYHLHAPETVTAMATTNTGKIIRVFVQQNPDIRGFRAVFDYKGEANVGADLRLFLKSDTKALTETWTYPVRNEFWA